MSEKLNELLSQYDEINEQLQELLNERTRIGNEIIQEKKLRGLSELAANDDQKTVNVLANQTLDQKKKQKEAVAERQLLVSRKYKNENTIIRVKDVEFGGSSHVIVAGPCSIESKDQLFTVAAALKKAGVTILRGGAFKPRTSPYDFQGLGVEGLKIMKDVADEVGMITMSEIMTPSQIDIAAQYIDIFQIGARNMQNFDLLKEVGKTNKPVLLKRGLSATLDEFIHAAEYILLNGNDQVMLMERGIRTFEKWTRNTLDISAVPILKQETHLPVLVDITHSVGRKDILLPIAKAALAVGAHGIMVEVHPNPEVALSDAKQQINIDEFNALWKSLLDSGLYI